MPRDYKREYALFHARPDQKKRRAERNASRRKMVQAGAVKKGDGMDVDHRDKNTGNMLRKNLRVMSASKNRSLK